MNEINWNDKNKRRWAFLIYKRLEMCQDELILTHEILASLGAPRMDKLSKEFKLKGKEEKQLNKWVSS
tara:strand:+ start:42 stop:245 length:204 start_codon:yes stop_codon:yes gene_type:complete